MARTFRSAGLPSEALLEVQKALASAPADVSALVLLGELNLALRPPGLDEAERAFRRTLELDPGQPDALAGVGEVRRRQGRAEEAERSLRRALALRPAHLGAAVGLARLAFSSGRAGEAVEELQEILRARPNEADPRLALAEVHASAPSGPQRRPEVALRLLDETRTLYGEDVEIRVRALAGAGRGAEAADLVAESPFLGSAARAALLRLAAGSGQ